MSFSVTTNLPQPLIIKIQFLMALAPCTMEVMREKKKRWGKCSWLQCDQLAKMR
jgi:hypothetical protein